jgi:hypothetical protein
MSSSPSPRIPPQKVSFIWLELLFVALVVGFVVLRGQAKDAPFKDTPFEGIVDVVATVLLGLWIHVLVGKIEKASELRTDALMNETRKHFDTAIEVANGLRTDTVMNETRKHFDAAFVNHYGPLPPTEMLKSEFGIHSELFHGYFDEEGRRVRDNLGKLHSERTWRLSDSPIYSAVTNLIPRAQQIQIVDQDIRRWYEILPADNVSPGDGPATTYSSRTILLELGKQMLGADEHGDFRRVFVIDPKQLNYKSYTSPKWKDLNRPLQVLLVIWTFEQKIALMRKEARKKALANMGTLVFDNLTLSTRKSLDKIEDVVIFNKELCVRESVTYDIQAKSVYLPPQPGRIITDRTLVSEARDGFDVLWSNCRQLDNLFPSDLKTLMNEVPTDAHKDLLP